MIQVSARSLALPLAALLLATTAGPAAAWHIAGKVRCDFDNSGTVTAADTPLSGLVVKVTSLVVSAGTTYTDGTDSSGAYFISLPDFPNAYDAEIINLPAGFTVISPAAGKWQNVQLTSTVVARDDIDFLVSGCGPTPTTTTSTTVTSTTSTSVPGTSTTSTSNPGSSSTSTSTTSTSTTSSTAPTTPTTLPVCDCGGFPFLVGRDAKFNNKADIFNSVGLNDPEGRIRLSKLVFMSDGTVVAGNDVTVGNFSDVYDVQANVLREGRDSTIRGTVSLPTLPIQDPFCPLDEFAFTCGGQDVIVDPGTTVTAFVPGTYGRVKLTNGAVLNLQAGTYDFCSLQLARRAVIRANGPVTINVTGNVRIGTASLIIATPGDGPVLIRMLGKSFRLSADALANVAVVAPNAKGAFGRRSLIDGCFCVDRAKTDKGTTFLCEAPGP